MANRKGRRIPRAKAIQVTANLTAKGWTSVQIADELRVNPRTVKDYRRAVANMPVDPVQDATLPESPIPRSEMAPEVLACLEDTPEGYRLFCNRYWPDEPMPDHIFSFVQSAYDYVAGRWRSYVILNVPPNHAKSTYFVMRWMAWRVCQNRDWRIIAFSQTAELATQQVGAVAMMLESPDFTRDFGPFRGEQMWQPGRGALRVLGFSLPWGFNILARGRGQQIQGFRADEIVGDDFVDIEDCITEDRRAKHSDWFHNYILSRTERGAVLRVIGTRQHPLDLYYELMETKRRDGEPVYKHINFKAVLDWDSQEVLWPETRPWDMMMDKYESMGASRFELTYQQNPLPAGSAMVRREWIYGRDNDPDVNKGCLDRERIWGPQDPIDGWVRVVSIDPSPTQYWCISVSDVQEVRGPEATYNTRVLEILRAKMSIREAMVHLARICQVYRPRFCIAEINAAQRWLMDDLDWKRIAKTFSVTLIPHTTTRNRSDPIYGLETLAADFEFQRIRLPYGDKETQNQMYPLINEALTAPYGSTDDCLMALWFPKPNLLAIRNRRPPSPNKRAGWGIPERLVGRKWGRVPERTAA